MSAQPTPQAPSAPATWTPAEEGPHAARGTLARIAGPMVEVRGLDGVALHEVVRVGEERLLGEVIRIDRDRATVQVFENTEGLRPGEPALATGAPFEVELGPGLLGRVYDGVQRPLAELARTGGDFIARGATAPALDRTARWDFEPAVRPGDTVVGGQRLGTARLPGAPGGRGEAVLVPPGVSGRVVEAAAVRAAVDEPVVRLAGGTALAMLHRWPVRFPRPVRRRLTPDVPFLTGQRVLDCFFPVAAGGAAVVPGGFGTGKTVLEQALAKHARADVIVYVGCGERGNEMTELLDEFPRLDDPRTGRKLLERTVLVVNTSNMPVAAREASIYTGITLAEYFRDQGLDVALMIDSTSRWAEALREMASRTGALPGEEGYPTYLGTRLVQLYERAGRAVPLSGAGEGSVTIVGAVSPPGGDFSEPVTQASLRATSVLWALAPELAQRRHFPAVDWSQSFTLDAPRLGPWFRREAGADWDERRDEAMRLLERERALQEIAQLVGLEALRDAERVVLESARLLREGFLRQNAYHPVDATCPPAKTLSMLRLFLHLARRAAAAVERGVPLRAILAAGLDRPLLRLGESPPADVAAAEPSLVAEIDAALARLEAEPWTS